MVKQARPDGCDADKIAKQLRDWVGKEIGPIAKPKDIRFGDNLPKTRSGKIMRRHSRLRHILEWKTPSQRRRLKKKAVVSPTDRGRVLAMIPGGSRG